MSANRLFLVCSHHPQLEHALCLGERAEGSATYDSAKVRQAWFDTHSKCGNPDDFQLAYHKPQNWDTAKPADETAIAVRLALAAGMTPGEDPAKFIHGDESDFDGGYDDQSRDSGRLDH